MWYSTGYWQNSMFTIYWLIVVGVLEIMRKPIPYKEPQKKEKPKSEKKSVGNVFLFILIEIFLIVISVALVAAISIIFNISTMISALFIGILIIIASYFISVKFFRQKKNK